MGANGFTEGFDEVAGRHRLVFRPGGPRLAVTFDEVGRAKVGSDSRDPWSYRFFSRAGYSVLGVLPEEDLWYRDGELHERLIALKDDGFFDQFERVVMSGTSMGGHGATTFASLAPGCTVVAFAPRIAGWYKKYPGERWEDWPGHFADAAKECRAAGHAYLIYDPFERIDVKHASRFDSPNVTHLHAPFLGHFLPRVFVQMGVLGEVTTKCLRHEMDALTFARLMAKRKEQPDYHLNLARGLFERRRRDAALRHCEWGAARFDDPRFAESRDRMLRAARVPTAARRARSLLGAFVQAANRISPPRPRLRGLLRFLPF